MLYKKKVSCYYSSPAPTLLEGHLYRYSNTECLSSDGRSQSEGVCGKGVSMENSLLELWGCLSRIQLDPARLYPPEAEREKGPSRPTPLSGCLNVSRPVCLFKSEECRQTEWRRGAKQQHRGAEREHERCGIRGGLMLGQAPCTMSRVDLDAHLGWS